MGTKSRKIVFKHYNSHWKIIRTKHLYDKRSSGLYRDEYISNEMYKDIFKMALSHGLSSFRNKGPVVITTPSFDKRFFSFLCEVDDKNNIIIITVFSTKENWWKSFIKVRNRINVIHDYTIPKMTNKERLDKKFDKVVHDIDNGNHRNKIDFNYIMSEMSDFTKL